MKKNLFEMGADLGEGWSADNKNTISNSKEIASKSPQEHRLYLSREKRRGKTVTIVHPFHLVKEELQRLLKILKKKLGTGGTIREDALEFQGDIPEQLRTSLEEMQYRFRI